MKHKIVVLSGLSGSGKTTIAERIKKDEESTDDWIHFDGDTWMSGGDPVEQSGKVDMKNNEDTSKGMNSSYRRDKEEIQQACQHAVAEGYNKLFAKEPPNLAAFESFYELMVQDVIKVFQQKLSTSESKKNIQIVMSHSVYCAQTRAFIKRRLQELVTENGNDNTIDKQVQLQVVVIRCSVNDLVDRRTDRAKQQAIDSKMSFEDYLTTTMKNGFPIPEPTESAFRDYVTLWNNGFDEANGDDEQELDVTDGKSVDEMYKTFCSIVNNH